MARARASSSSDDAADDGGWAFATPRTLATSGASDAGAYASESAAREAEVDDSDRLDALRGMGKGKRNETKARARV